MPIPQQNIFMSLSNSIPSLGKFAGRFLTNSIFLGGLNNTEAIFPKGSRLNHSCNPNCVQSWNTITDRFHIHALREIKKGEELTIYYVDGRLSFQERQEQLKIRNYFDCYCSVCSLPVLERRQSDKRLISFQIAQEAIYLTTNARRGLNLIHKLLSIEKKEGRLLGNRQGFYFKAFEYSIALGDLARAKVFLEKAYEVCVLFEGEDCQRAFRYKHYLDNPKVHVAFRTQYDGERWDTAPPNGVDELEEWLWNVECVG